MDSKIKSLPDVLFTNNPSSGGIAGLYEKSISKSLKIIRIIVVYVFEKFIILNKIKLSWRKFGIQNFD